REASIVAKEGLRAEGGTRGGLQLADLDLDRAIIPERRLVGPDDPDADPAQRIDQHDGLARRRQDVPYRQRHPGRLLVAAALVHTHHGPVRLGDHVAELARVADRLGRVDGRDPDLERRQAAELSEQGLTPSGAQRTPARDRSRPTGQRPADEPQEPRRDVDLEVAASPADRGGVSRRHREREAETYEPPRSLAGPFIEASAGQPRLSGARGD